MSYQSIVDHQHMLLDEHRNSLYAKALKQVITKDSIVLDLGAGLGLHGLVAASMGAKRVYLVEPGVDLEAARRVAKDNGLDDRMVYLQGTIEEVTLPEKVDVIISVFTGIFLLGEDLLPSLFYARDRYLKPTGCMLPESGVMKVAAVSMEKRFRQDIECWSDPIQGIKFASLRQYAANSLFYHRYNDSNYRFLSEPATLCELDFLTARTAECKQKISIGITGSGLCHGYLGWFETKLGSHWLSTSPQATKTHWRQVFLPLDPPLRLHEGEALSLELNRPEFGEWTWITGYRERVQKHSTFLSEPISPAAVRKKSDLHKARVNEKGLAARSVLQMLDGKHSTDYISATLQETFPGLFPGAKDAKRFVHKMIDRFT